MPAEMKLASIHQKKPRQRLSHRESLRIQCHGYCAADPDAQGNPAMKRCKSQVYPLDPMATMTGTDADAQATAR
jgi:hypothetical protein